MDPAPTASAGVTFGRFRVLPQRREVLADGQPMKLGGRAFDVLLALIEAQGAVVSKAALMARVWPHRVVEENVLQAQISALRAALGAERGLIRTVSGRGYQFAGDIRPLSARQDERDETGAAAAPPRSTPPATNLPQPVSELIGRDEELREILGLATAHRLVSLVGPGGIGKTRLAIAAARALLADFADGAWLAEFSSLSDAGLVAATVAAAAGLEMGAGEVSAPRVARALGGRRLLLVLDTCEHVIDAAAELAEAVLRTAPGVRVIITSREPLRAEGEQIYAVPPLAVPGGGGEDPWRCGAVRLFAVRSREGGADMTEEPRAGLATAAICRQLDGIPLAIELAAARAAALGIAELGARLGDRFNLLTGGRRTALPRHRTLRATLDWSFELLSEAERAILRRLAVFAGTFSLEAATAVVADADIAPADVVEGLSSLVTKSLVATATDRTILRYRLLDTARAYATEKLVERGEQTAVALRHAGHCRLVLAEAGYPQDEGGVGIRRATYTREIDNVRAALTWAFGPDADATTAVALAAASAPLWTEMSLLSECRSWMEAAVSRLDDTGAIGTRQEMIIQAALGVSLMYTHGSSNMARAALTRAYELAECYQDLDYQLRALVPLALFCVRSEDFGGALVLARRVEGIAKSISDGASISISHCIIGLSLYFLGEYSTALPHLRLASGNVTPLERRAQILHFGMDYSILARCIAPHILWLHGLFDRSVQSARDVLADAQEAGHPASICQALAWCGCSIPLRLGDLDSAGYSIALLKDHAERYGFSSYYAFGLGYEGQLSAARGDVVAGAQLLRAALNGLRGTQYENIYTTFLVALAGVLAMAGDFSASLATVDDVLHRTENNSGFSWRPEALRIKGEVLLSSKPIDATAAEDEFRRSLELARRQGTLSWELRSATSFARLLLDQGRPADAQAILQPVYDRFTEGFDTADLKTAKALLDAIGKPGRDGREAAASRVGPD